MKRCNRSAHTSLASELLAGHPGRAILILDGIYIDFQKCE